MITGNTISIIIFGFVTMVTRRVPMMSGAGIANPSEAPEFTPVFSGVRVAKPLVFSVVFCRSLFDSFSHCIVGTSLIYGI